MRKLSLTLSDNDIQKSLCSPTKPSANINPKIYALNSESIFSK